MACDIKTCFQKMSWNIYLFIFFFNTILSVILSIVKLIDLVMKIMFCAFDIKM